MSYDCVCDYDPATIYRRDIVKARKQHKCDECAGNILPGEQYEYVFGVWEGWASSFKTCERCVDITTWVKNNVPCLCWAHGNRVEDCKEAIEEASWRAGEEAAGLRFGLLRRIVQRDRLNKARDRARV